MAIRSTTTSNLLLIIASAVMAGCATTPSDTPSPRPVAVPDAPAAETVSDMQSAAADPIDRLLAERRRGDFPEIRTEATGFSITEQVRIAGDAYSSYDRALGLLRQERYREAIAELVELTEKAPEITAPYVDLGIAYGHTGDLERAAAALETAALLSPEHPIVHNELGIVYRRSGRFHDARAEYEKALAVFSDFHFARRNLAVLCDLYLADVECALQNYRMYLDSVGEDPEVEIWIADLAARSGQNF